MKPHPNMSYDEIQKYLDYLSQKELTLEEKSEYREWLAQAKDEGCDYSVVPIQIIHQGPEATDAYYQKILEKRAKEWEEFNAKKAELDKLSKHNAADG